MDHLAKIIVVPLWIAMMVWLLVFFDKMIRHIGTARWRDVSRALLYAVMFTPTAYHHSPNTIIAPLHLSTLCGNLFYPYEYTGWMFLYGVAVPIGVAWCLITLVLLFRRLSPTSGPGAAG